MRKFTIFLLLLLSACGTFENVGRLPELTSTVNSPEYTAMMAPTFQPTDENPQQRDQASLWSGGRESLLGDRRAITRGDIMTVVIEIDDKAEFSNSSSRSRSGSENLAIPSLLGIPQRLNNALPDGASLDAAADVTSSSSSAGDGSVRRNEKLTLRVAATIVKVLQNGVLQIQGTQEVRVNFEVRELIVSGFVRPEDISRLNEITYDKIASARISYGGRGLISDAQQPRYGQQIADIILPF